MPPRQKFLLAATLALTLGLGLGLYEIRQAARVEEHIVAAEQSAAQARLATTRRLADLSDENARLRTEGDRLRAAAPAAPQAPSAAASPALALDPSLRAMADWLESVQTLKARIQARPEIAIPEQWLTEKDWLDAVKGPPLTDETDFRRAASRLRAAADRVFTLKASSALQRYLQAHENKFPSDITQLQAYFEPPIASALLQRWAVKPAKTMPDFEMGGDWVITQKTAVDEEVDSCTAIGLYGAASHEKNFNPEPEALNAVLTAFEAAHPGRAQSATMHELLPYATTPEQKAALAKVAAAQSSGAP